MKVLKAQEANGGPVHFVEVDSLEERLDSNVNKAHFETYDLGKGDTNMFNGSGDRSLNAPNGSGDMHYENDRF